MSSLHTLMTVLYLSIAELPSLLRTNELVNKRVGPGDKKRYAFSTAECQVAVAHHHVKQCNFYIEPVTDARDERVGKRQGEGKKRRQVVYGIGSFLTPQVKCG